MCWSKPHTRFFPPSRPSANQGGLITITLLLRLFDRPLLKFGIPSAKGIQYSRSLIPQIRHLNTAQK